MSAPCAPPACTLVVSRGKRGVTLLTPRAAAWESGETTRSLGGGRRAPLPRPHPAAAGPLSPPQPLPPLLTEQQLLDQALPALKPRRGRPPARPPAPAGAAQTAPPSPLQTRRARAAPPPPAQSPLPVDVKSNGGGAALSQGDGAAARPPPPKRRGRPPAATALRWVAAMRALARCRL